MIIMNNSFFNGEFLDESKNFNEEIYEDSLSDGTVVKMKHF